MNLITLSTNISAIAAMISKNICDEDELALVACIFSQLGDTLATMSLQRSICEKSKQNAENGNVK